MRLQREIAELKSRYGATLDDLTAEEVAGLVHACERVENPFHAANVALIEKPVEVCRGVVLWPPTAGAQIWLDEFAEKWWPEGTMRYRWAQIYALIHARKPEAFEKLTEKGRAWRAITLTAIRLCVHRRELLKALNAAYGVDEWEVPDKSRVQELANRAQLDFSKMVARLEVQSGIPRNSWLWERGFVETAHEYAEMHALATIAVGGSARQGMIDELDEALNNLARLKSSIWLRLKDRERKTEAEHGSGE